MRLSLHPQFTPEALIPLPEAAKALGLKVEQCEAWCRSGCMHGTLYKMRWYISEKELQRFVEGSVWRLIMPPTWCEEKN